MRLFIGLTLLNIVLLLSGITYGQFAPPINLVYDDYQDIDYAYMQVQDELVDCLEEPEYIYIETELAGI